ncbi:MAG: hypothetical protein JNG83_11580 [Opitutaceae bacterium]|nr:hypothetical protein [Opitutaceae bacterium]
MTDFLRALGFPPWAYWTAALTALAAWLAVAAFPSPAGSSGWSRLRHPTAFALLLLGAMFALRWPAIFHFRPVNPDEAQFLAGALTILARGELGWLDATTSGPLVVLPLTLPGLLGTPVDFAAGRLVALLLQWGTVVLAYLSLRHLHGDRPARLLVLPLAAFYACLLFWDFVPYSSESAPVFLCALAAWLLLTAFSAEGLVTRRARLAAGGGVLGLLPFSKFQVIPLGAALGSAVLTWLLFQPTDRRRKLADAAGLAAGVVAGAGGMLLALGASGHGADFYESYWVHNLFYAGAGRLPDTSPLELLAHLSGFSWGFSAFQLGLLLLVAVGTACRSRPPWRSLLLGWSLVLAAYLAVVVPGRLYPHYLLFLPLPLALLAAITFGPLIARSRRPVLWWTLFLGVGAGAPLVDRAWDRHDLSRLVPAAGPRDRVVAFINHVKRPGDTLAIWGWRPEVYVETQLPQATREALAEAQINVHPQRDYYRARFLADLEAGRPAFFLDATGPADFILHDRDRYGHEIFPALHDLVTRSYTLVSRQEPLRLYVRNDLLAR